ncbi:cytochrome P450 [Pseudomonas typographi]|uniref:cytochrome P450 n=1 Tax=Pseudomonas typographi TaxID=2715964 RepID=UPI001683D37D|nr:cytochrome P450 [Pseudomonas typographi]MBD1551518.1 cytochrome P450 [Pseudomonas typographi]
MADIAPAPLTASSKPRAPRPANVPSQRVVEFDMFDPPGLQEGLHSAWKRLQDPSLPDLVWTPYNGGHWIATRGKLIKQMFLDHEHFSSECPFLPREAGEQYSFIPTSMDPPQQRPFRRVLNEGIGPKVVDRVKDAIEQLSRTLIADIRNQGRCDFTREYAEIFPIHIFLMIVDLPVKDAARLKYIGDQMTRPDGSMSMAEAIRAFFDYLSPFIDERMRTPGEDAISIIVHSEVNGRPLSKDEALNVCGLVLLAGLDTVVNFLSFSLHYLATHPVERQMLVDDPELIPAATEELLRRFGLVSDARLIKQAIHVDGVLLQAGDMVALPTLLFGLDEREHGCPMHVDFNRADKSHITFGHGVHHCAGAHLARLEVQTTLREWLRQIPDFEIAAGAEIGYQSGIVGAMTRLPLVWATPAAILS